MAVLQPLYFAGGRYTASIDRKLLAALIDPEKTGKRIAGVIPPSPSMLVSGSTTSTIAVAPGFCVIPDSDSPSSASPGLYLCAIDSSSETLPTIPAQTTGSRIDLIYASVSETSFAITNKSLTSNKATIYTSANHGFTAGQTVVISGVDEIFDGSYVILGAGAGEEADVPTNTTFKYERTFGSNIASAFVTPVVRRATSTTEVVVTGTAIPSTNQVTFTTETISPSSYVAGETVTVIGVSNELDGTYRVLEGSVGTVPSATSFTVAKISSIAPSVNATLPTSTNNPSTTAKPISSVAKARVPFAIKRAQGTAGTGIAASLPAGRNLELARLTITGTSVTRQDVRQFTSGTGGIRLYNSAAPGTAYDPDGSIGGARYDIATNRFELYSTTVGDVGWQPVFYGSTNHHDSVAANASNAALHHTIGTGQFNAARGDHIHTVNATGTTGRLGYNPAADYYDADGTDRIITSRNSASPTLIKSSPSLSMPANSRVLVMASGSVSVSSSNSFLAIGLRERGGTSSNIAYIGDPRNDTGTTFGYHSFSLHRYFEYSTAKNVIFELTGHLDDDSRTTGATPDSYNVFIYQLTVIPFSQIITNSLSAPS
jgi:hypothetical protein